MVLTNLAQIAMTATDVMMMGRAGPGMLAAGALGANLYFAPLIFGLGLMNATSPMMAAELGRNRHSVRDIRRTVRQGLWIAVLVSHPDLADPVEHRGDPCRHGAGSRRWPRRPASTCTGCNGRCCLSTATSCCARSWRRSSGRAGRWSSWSSRSTFNAFANWCLIFGNLGFPRDGHRRLRARHHAVEHPDVRRAGGCRFRRARVSPLPSVRPLLALRLAALPRR